MDAVNDESRKAAWRFSPRCGMGFQPMMTRAKSPCHPERGLRHRASVES